MFTPRLTRLGAVFSKTVNEERPSSVLLWLEGRALWELASLPLALPWLHRMVPKGDGHPVLVFPGFMASDASTRPLRHFLKNRGYDVHGWGQGANLGPREGVLERMHDTLARLHASTGRKVSLIGWSLGGIYAREVARAAPERVRQVISLGSPLYGEPHTSSNVWHAYKWVSGRSRIQPGDRGDGPPPVPTTSIYTRSDSIVGWGCCVEKQGPRTDNIEINTASHTGLGVNPLVLYVIGNRLAQGEDDWSAFKPKGALKALYPFKAAVR